jgi:hypothetical protein
VRWEEIRALVINPVTGNPISKPCAFKRELAEGKAKLKSLIATRFYEALDRGDSWVWNSMLCAHSLQRILKRHQNNPRRSCSAP